MKSVEIREARADDLEFVRTLIRELAVFERLEADCTGTIEELRESLFGANPRAKVLLAFHGGEPAGFAVYFFTYSTFAARPILYLEDLYVRPEERGRGIGQQLLGKLCGIAEENGCVRMEWSVLDWNTRAREFYEGLGAVPQKSWLKYALPGTRTRELARKAAGSSQEV